MPGLADPSENEYWIPDPLWHEFLAFFEKTLETCQKGNQVSPKKAKKENIKENCAVMPLLASSIVF
jgi:hypothetical protein